MLRFLPILMATSLAAALAAHGQTTPPAATPQTTNSAPAATSPAATGAQAAEAAATRNSATRGSRSRGQAGARRGGQRAPGQGGQTAADQPGITGVPGYSASYTAQKGTPAPDANASVTIIGDANGTAVGKPAQTAALPGIVLLHNAYGIAKGTLLHVRLQQPVDSGHARNGEMVPGVLTAPVGTAPAGAPVQLTVVAVAAAGQISSNGELSLQVVSVNGEAVISDVITAEGKEGTKLVPDAAPARGTEAIFSPDQPLTVPAG